MLLHGPVQAVHQRGAHQPSPPYRQVNAVLQVNLPIAPCPRGSLQIQTGNESSPPIALQVNAVSQVYLAITRYCFVASKYDT